MQANDVVTDAKPFSSATFANGVDLGSQLEDTQECDTSSAETTVSLKAMTFTNTSLPNYFNQFTLKDTLSLVIEMLYVFRQRHES